VDLRLCIFSVFKYIPISGYDVFVKRLIQILFGIFLLTFPLSMRWVVYESASYRFGHFNPWVTGFVYLPEVLLLGTFVLWVIQKRKNEQEIDFKSKVLWIVFGLFAANAFLVTLIQGDPFLGALFILRLFEGLIVFWLITDRILLPQQTVTFLLFGAMIQIVWGYAQFRLNHSLGLGLLGESFLGPDVLGVAKLDLANGFRQIRAYGSFLHPNILAAYLLIIFFIGLNYLKRRGVLLWAALFSLGLYLTHSRAAMLAGGTGLILYFIFAKAKTLSFKKSVIMAVGLALIVVNAWFFVNSSLIRVSDVSWQERLTQNQESFALWKKKPFGFGVSNYTLKLERIAPTKLQPWDFQPVHNTFFLTLNEVGAQGFALLVVFLFILFSNFWQTANATPAMVLLLLAPFDHYLWDSFAGLILVALAAGFFALENQEPIGGPIVSPIVDPIVGPIGDPIGDPTGAPTDPQLISYR